MNGWKNYETWAAYCWLTSNEPAQKAIEQAAGEAVEAAGGDGERAVVILGERIREATEETSPDLSGLYSDLLNYALQNIDYLEIARAFFE